MNLKKLAQWGVLIPVTAALTITGCTTTQLQKKHTSFESCFREEKVLAMVGGAILGGVAGQAVAGTGGAVVGAVVGGVIGNRLAWQACLGAFPGKTSTEVITPRAAALSQGGASNLQAATTALTIQTVQVGILEFGKDLEISVAYRFISDNPAARDIKAKVSRNIVFKGPDGALQEVATSTDDVIQQGVIQSKFAIPTPSIQEAKELASTSDWAFKFAVEVAGLKQEQTVPIRVPQLSGAASTDKSTPAGAAAAAAPASHVAPPAAPATETITVKRGTAILKATTGTAVVVRLQQDTKVTVLQRKVESKVNWVQLRLPDGQEGWIRGAPR
jgi:hypothetical protein